MEGWRENLGCFCNFVFISFFSVVVSWDFFSVFVYIQKDFFIKCIWEMLRNILGFKMVCCRGLFVWFNVLFFWFFSIVECVLESVVVDICILYQVFFQVLVQVCRQFLVFQSFFFYMFMGFRDVFFGKFFII